MTRHPYMSGTPKLVVNYTDEIENPSAEDIDDALTELGREQYSCVAIAWSGRGGLMAHSAGQLGYIVAFQSENPDGPFPTLVNPAASGGKVDVNIEGESETYPPWLLAPFALVSKAFRYFRDEGAMSPELTWTIWRGTFEPAFVPEMGYEPDGT